MSQVFALIDFVHVSLDLFWGRLLKTSGNNQLYVLERLSALWATNREVVSHYPSSILSIFFSMVDRENQSKVHVSRKREKIHLAARHLCRALLSFSLLRYIQVQVNAMKQNLLKCILNSCATGFAIAHFFLPSIKQTSTVRKLRLAYRVKKAPRNNTTCAYPMTKMSLK